MIYYFFIYVAKINPFFETKKFFLNFFLKNNVLDILFNTSIIIKIKF